VSAIYFESEGAAHAIVHQCAAAGFDGVKIADLLHGASIGISVLLRRNGIDEPTVAAALDRFLVAAREEWIAPHLAAAEPGGTA